MNHPVPTSFLTTLCLMVAASALALPALSARVSAQAPKEDAPSPGNAQSGKKIFMANGCYECHQSQAQGALTGPRLGPDPMPFTEFVKSIRQPRGDMPIYTSKVMSDADLADVYAFLKALPPPSKISWEKQ